MKNTIFIPTRVMLVIVGILVGNLTFAQLRLPALICDGMVLQRDSKVNVWGWAIPGEEVTVSFNRHTYKAVVEEDKKWKIILPATPARTAGDLTIRTKEKTITIKNIIFGDVWLCSGQSNMEFTMDRLARKYPGDITASANPYIRQFLVKRVYSFTVKDSFDGTWQAAQPDVIGQFSAVAYYMAKSLYDKYKVPIGIIHSSWGGTPAEAWISEEGLAGFNNYLDKLHYYQDPANVKATQLKDWGVADKWYDEVKKGDKGLMTNGQSWASLNAETIGWRNIKVPGFWQEQGLPGLTGVVWYKKEVDIPASMAGKDVDLELGMIDDNDSTYFNGIKVGSTTSKYLARVYHVPASLIHPGKNILTVRITNTDGNGGFIVDKKYRLVNHSDTVNLEGDWQCKIGVAVPGLAVSSFTRLYYQPSSLYNSMIAPLISYTIKGVAWYQGEANTNRAKEYRTLLPAMIADWRNRWHEGNFPFLIVQLANYMPAKQRPSQSDWAELREAQLLITQTVPNTALAVTIDIGEANDVHPLNKRDVGKRLALAAEKLAYKEHIVYSGPEYKSMEVKGNKIILSFNHIGSGLTTSEGQPLKQFAIAGTDGQFVWANAEIKGDKVVVWNDSITVPVAVRYAWADNPVGCNLFNKEGLPASPFRTDYP
jgi:sialate O-acetylesterase